MNGPPSQGMSDDGLMKLLARVVELNDISAHKDISEFIVSIIRKIDPWGAADKAPRDNAHIYLYEVGLKALLRCYASPVDSPTGYVRRAISLSVSSIWRDIGREERAEQSLKAEAPAWQATNGLEQSFYERHIVAHLQAAAECARGNNDITREYMFGIILRAYLFGDTLTEAARSFGVTAQEWQRIERTLQRDRKNPKSQLIMMVLQVVDEHSLPIELRN